jgi:hypothetical protein
MPLLLMKAAAEFVGSIEIEKKKKKKKKKKHIMD